MTQRQRRDWRDSSHYRAISGKSRLRGAAEPLSAACPGSFGGAGVRRSLLRESAYAIRESCALLLLHTYEILCHHKYLNLLICPFHF
jgi:hypothetical protein